MNKTIMKRITALLLAAAIVAGIWVAMPNDRDSYAGETVIATPTIQKIGCSKTSNGDGSVEGGPTYSYPGYRFTFNGKETTYWRNTDLSKYMPIYSIKQSNGYGANYVKLRDIAFFADFNVQWSFSDPNAMYIWTNNHYAEGPKLSGPATETKVGEWSTYDIYVDGVKVEGLQPVLIDDNNYFKIRDIARIVNLGCIYDITTEKVYIEGNLQYVEENELQNYGSDAKAWLENSPKRSVVFQHIRPTYGYPSGTVSTTPVTLTENDPWARENYFDKYASQELKDALGYDPSSNSAEQIKLERIHVAMFNRVVQVLIDQEVIAQSEAEGRYYVYPMDNTNFGMRPSETTAEIDGIKELMSQFGTDRERLESLAEIVCKKVMYEQGNWRENLAEKGLSAVPDDFEGPTKQNGEFFLDYTQQIVGQCGTYATTFDYLCKSVGYCVLYEMGHGHSHQWSYVWLPDEGKWVGVDCTWSDNFSGNGKDGGFSGTFIGKGDQPPLSYIGYEPESEGDPHPFTWEQAAKDNAQGSRSKYVAIIREAFETAYMLSPQRYTLDTIPLDNGLTNLKQG